MPNATQTIAIASSVIVLHAAGLWALHTGTARPRVEAAAPLHMLARWVEPPQTTPKVEIASAAAHAAAPTRPAAQAAVPPSKPALPRASPMATKAGIATQSPVAAPPVAIAQPRPTPEPALARRNVTPAPRASMPSVGVESGSPAVEASRASDVAPPSVPKTLTIAGARAADVTSAAAQAAQGAAASAASQLTSATTATGSPSGAQAPTSVELPSSDAMYLQNPEPPYPPISKRLGEQGTVFVKVLVSVDGHAKNAQVQASSGYTRLDNAALSTVRNWRFVPGRRAGLAESMWFIVPITFGLR